MEEAFWGRHYWDWVWVVTSEMERRMCMYVCVRVQRSMFKKRKWGCAEWQMNGQAKDTKGEAIFRECEKQQEGMEKRKRWGGGGLQTLRQPNDREECHTHFSYSQSHATSSLHWDTLEVSVRSISTTVLTFSTWLPSLVFLSAALSLLNVVCIFSHTSSLSHTLLVWTTAYESTVGLPSTRPRGGHSFYFMGF